MSKVYESEDEIIIESFLKTVNIPSNERKAFDAGYMRGFREGYIAAQEVYLKNKEIKNGYLDDGTRKD